MVTSSIMGIGVATSVSEFDYKPLRLCGSRASHAYMKALSGGTSIALNS